MTLTAGGRSAQPSPDVPTAPYCQHCGTNQYLIVEEFTPLRLLPDGQRVPANASYSCSRCGSFSGHEVPDSWTPVGWFWYA
jgi:5-methylcytosine-specific restriction endonuclease McrA